MVAPVIRVAGVVGLCAAATLAGCGQPSAPSPAPGVGSGAQDQPPAPRGAARPLPAACTDGTLGDVARPNLPGPGVTVDQRDIDVIRAEADAWTLPAGVTFTLAAPTIEDRQIVLRGVLANTTTTPQPVFLTEAGAGFFHATVIGDVGRALAIRGRDRARVLGARPGPDRDRALVARDLGDRPAGRRRGDAAVSAPRGSPSVGRGCLVMAHESLCDPDGVPR